jgi:hypothetical protein
MKRFQSLKSPARGDRNFLEEPISIADTLFASGGPALSKKTCRPWRGSGQRGTFLFPGAYAAGLLPVALRAEGRDVCKRAPRRPPQRERRR